jgi:hypothetical protein
MIEADPARPVFIHTVRGVGYVFRRPASRADAVSADAAAVAGGSAAER